jgi:TetR/AcrR family transcriptional repressor of nem operon
MPWVKSFNIDETLDIAMRMFWSRGYEATSMQDLVQGMGINRGSLYDTYSDKRSLFIAALRHYDKAHRKTRLAKLEREHSPKVAIEALFVDWIDLVTTDADRRGCFLTNTALELSVHDAEIGAIVATSQKETEQFFRRLIKRGQSIGKIDQALDATQSARLLLAALIGLLVLARSRPERTLLKSIASSAMGSLQ